MRASAERQAGIRYMREHQSTIRRWRLRSSSSSRPTKEYNALDHEIEPAQFRDPRRISWPNAASRAGRSIRARALRPVGRFWPRRYAEIALSDEFRKVYGDVANAQMRVRSQLQQESSASA